MLFGVGRVQLPNPEPYIFFLGGFHVYSDSHVVHWIVKTIISFWKMSTREKDNFQGTKGVLKIHKSKTIQWPKIKGAQATGRVKYCNEDDRSLIHGWDRHTNMAGLNRLIWPQLSCWTHCLIYSYCLCFLCHWRCVHFNCMRLLHEMTIHSHLPWRAALYKGKFHDLRRFWPSCLGKLIILLPETWIIFYCERACWSLLRRHVVHTWLDISFISLSQ